MNGNGGCEQSYDIDEDSEGNMHKITFTRPDRSRVVQTRPDVESQEFLLWELCETFRRAARRKRELQSAINKVQECIAPYARRAGSTKPQSSSNPKNDFFDAALPPEPIQWHSKELKYQRLADEIAATYFLQVEECTTDKHGRQYIPALRPDPDKPGKNKWHGSRLGGKFPHAIVSQKKTGDTNSTRTEEYMCAATDMVEVTVRLKKWTPNGNNSYENCSEDELLQKITGEYAKTEREKWGFLEDKLTVYMYLEFADGEDRGAPVSMDAFNRAPENGALLKPREALPSYLNNGRPGYYEQEMKRGAVTFSEFKFQESVTSSNLNKNNKGRLMRFVFKVINPFLVNMECMTAQSSPFVVKAVVHNNVKRDERYVLGPDGVAIDSPKSDLPAHA